MRGILACVGGIGLFALASPITADEMPDLAKIEHRLVKEPSYKSKQPLYGLYVFGPAAKTRVWAVLDKSKYDLDQYDILYFDRNADGDLTAANERIDGKNGAFAVGTFVDPVTKQEHTNITITRVEGPSGRVFLEINWCGKVRVAGGYAADAGPYTQFGRTPAEAPVLWPAADGPLGFQFWQVRALAIGASDDVRVFLGHQGHGRNTFCALPDTFLPKEVPVLATLIYADKNGKEQRAQSELRERC